LSISVAAIARADLVLPEKSLMKIAFVNQPWDVSSPPTPRGSLGLWTYHVARRLAREPDCEVTVYESPRSDAPAQEQRAEGVIYRYASVTAGDRMAERLLPRLSKLRAPQRGYFLSARYYLGYATRIARDLRAHGCNVVSIHSFSQFVPAIRAHNPGAKIILHMNCDWLAQMDAATLEPRLAQCDLILGCTEHVTSGVRQRFPHHAHKCCKVFNGVDTDWFAPADRQLAAAADANQSNLKNILFCGRVSPEKGVHDLLDAMAEVVKRFPEARLEILGGVGAAPKEFMVSVSADPKVRDLARFYENGWDYGAALRQRMTPEVAARTTFTNHLPQPQVAERVRQADLLVLPSLTESFGMPLAEAMASGVPVVATRAGGMPELVEDGVTGMLVDSANPPGLANAIERLLADPALRRSMGELGRKRAVRLFSWDAVAASALAEYRAALCSPEAAVA
jgi:glycosyltransferase involved in cell wall biosynthesis